MHRLDGAIAASETLKLQHGHHPAADIGVMNDRIGHHRARIAIADHPSVVQHDQTAADPHHLFEIVLDQHHGDAAPVHRGNGLDLPGGLGMVEAGQRFVEQDDPRIDRQSARDLEPLHLAERQRASQLSLGAGQSDLAEDVGRTLILAAPIDCSIARNGLEVRR